MMNELGLWWLVFLGFVLGIVWTIVAIVAYEWWEEKKQREANVDALIHSLAKHNNTFMNEIIRLEEELKQEREKNK